MQWRASRFGHIDDLLTASAGAASAKSQRKVVDTEWPGKVRQDVMLVEPSFHSSSQRLIVNEARVLEEFIRDRLALLLFGQIVVYLPSKKLEGRILDELHGLARESELRIK